MKENITIIAKRLLSNNWNKIGLSLELGISRPTLDKRLIEHNWKLLESQKIKSLA
tara:strand:+ start:909 stop:1073 length:165 start_codon:yes stop_codon:yes gene_type:complete